MILALDLATVTGFCWGAGGRLPTIGHFVLPSTGGEVGPYLVDFERRFTDLVNEVAPDLVAFEAPIQMRRNTPAVTRKLHALPGVVEMVCFRRGIEVREVAPMVVKKALTGHGNADKNLMCDTARAYGLRPAVHDEADAFGVWLAVLRRRFPERAGRWDLLPFNREDAP